eukprot:g3055.t1
MMMMMVMMMMMMILALSTAQAEQAEQLEVIADFGWGDRPTGVAVTNDADAESRRVFVSFPRWFKNHSAPSVAEVVDGNLVAFPNATWNSWKEGDENVEEKFLNCQSVFIDHFDRLWALDVGAVYLQNVTRNAPKLVLIDLKTNAVERIYPLQSIAEENSYLNDVRISADGKHAFLTDSNVGGIRHLDLATGEGRVLLADDPSTHSEPGFITSVEGQPMILVTGAPAAYQSDGIAVVQDYVYYHACTGRTLYRIKQDLLIDPSYSAEEVSKGVEVVSLSGVPDGLVLLPFDDALSGRLFMTAVEKDGIDYLAGNDSGSAVLPLISDELLQWPDSLSAPRISASGDNYVYATASQVNHAPFIQDARPRRNPYQLFRVKIPAGVLGKSQ